MGRHRIFVFHEIIHIALYLIHPAFHSIQVIFHLGIIGRLRFLFNFLIQFIEFLHVLIIGLLHVIGLLCALSGFSLVFLIGCLPLIFLVSTLFFLLWGRFS